jgi:hypothetical protein
MGQANGGEWLNPARVTVAVDGEIRIDNDRASVVVNGARETIRIGCHSVTYAALERIYDLYRRHRDDLHYEAQR